MQKARQLLPFSCELGEGCMWDASNLLLYFVDIEGCTIYSWDQEKDAIRSYNTNGRVGCVVPQKNGRITAAVTDHLMSLDPATGRSSKIMQQNLPHFIRYNDGKCGPDGSLWIGTMAVSQAHPEAEGCGSLYQIKDNEIIHEYSGFTIPNGLAWNPDGTVFYHIDTPTRTIFAYDYEGIYGISARRPTVMVKPEDGSPDGMCADADGNLWTAHWGGGKVLCYEPGTGKILEEIRVPARYVSCAAFGGKNLDTLYITTARDEEGYGGQLYGVDMDRKGVLPYVYEGVDGGKKA